MSHVYFIGDTHFGHKNITRFRKEFSSEVEHSNFICEQWCDVVTKRDIVYVMGDAAFTRQGLLRFYDLPGRKILVRGNHDELNALEYLGVFDDVCGLMQYKKSWLSHAPIHESELRGRFNVHGHCHAGGPAGLYFNVCAEHINYTPINYQVILDEIAKLSNET